MKIVTYRPLEKSDYETIKQIICEAFGFHKWLTNPRFLDIVLSLYLHSCLNKSTFSSVAVLEGQVIGIILGSIPKHCPKTTSISHQIQSIRHMMRLPLVPKKERMALSTFKEMDKVYEALIAGKSDDFDGSIALFAVTEACRGLGVGKALMAQLLDYMQSQAAKQIYLYTDTICNYGFYESQGFKRLAEQRFTMPATVNGQVPPPLTVFLYAYTLNS